MNRTDFMTTGATTNPTDCSDALTAFSNTFSAGLLQGDRGSEARRFLFSADPHVKRKEASPADFPAKFAWIAVVLFALSLLIAFLG